MEVPDTYKSDDYLVLAKQEGREAGMNSKFGTINAVEVDLMSRSRDLYNFVGGAQEKYTGESQKSDMLVLSFRRGPGFRRDGEDCSVRPLLKAQNDATLGVGSERVSET